MTTPAPQPPTQVQYPWRATIRTAFAAIVGALSLLPAVAFGLHIDTVPQVIQVIAVTSGITRVLAMPVVHDWMNDNFPWLLATPKQNP